MSQFSLYTPIHSNLKWGESGILATGKSFGMVLQSRAISYSQLCVPVSRTPARFHLYPEACVHVFFEIDPNNIAAWIYGPLPSLRVSTLHANGEYFDVSLRVDQAYELLGIPIQHFGERKTEMEDVWPQQAKHLKEHLSQTKTFSQRVSCIESFFLHKHLQPSQMPDEISTTVKHILHSPLQESVENLSRRIGWSGQRLRRQFDKYVGLSPKKFSKIVRFQQVLQTLSQQPDIDHASLALDFGYYDQSHFIHEFKSFYGASPSCVSPLP